MDVTLYAGMAPTRCQLTIKRHIFTLPLVRLLRVYILSEINFDRLSGLRLFQSGKMIVGSPAAHGEPCCRSRRGLAHRKRGSREFRIVVAEVAGSIPITRPAFLKAYDRSRQHPRV